MDTTQDQYDDKEIRKRLVRIARRSTRDADVIKAIDSLTKFDDRKDGTTKYNPFKILWEETILPALIVRPNSTRT